MIMEAKFSALKGYIDCEISILNSKVDQFIESLKETITKIEKRESSSIEVLQKNIHFLQKELLVKKQFNKIPDQNSDSHIRGYSKPKRKTASSTRTIKCNLQTAD